MILNLQKANFKQASIIGFCIILTVVSLAILQDMVHSQIKNYHFIFLESLLYNTFWMYFFPFGFFALNKIHWLKNLSKTSQYAAFLVSVLVFSSLHLLLFPLGVFLISELFFTHTYTFIRVLNYTLSEHLYLCLCLYVGIGVWVLYRLQKENISIKKKPLNILTINNGTERTLIKVENICCIKAESPYVAIFIDSKKFLYSDTLKSLSQQLHADEFVRIHKSTIVNLEKISSYKSRKNGDYDMLLKNGMMVRMSRNYRSGLKMISF